MGRKQTTSWITPMRRPLVGCMLSLSLALTGCVAAEELDEELDEEALRVDGPRGAHAIATTPDGSVPPSEPREPCSRCEPRGPAPKPGPIPVNGPPAPCGEAPTPSYDGGAPAPVACTGHTFGDGRTCSTYDDLKQLAASLCSAEGAVIVDVKLGEPCEGGASSGWVSCCQQPAPTDAGPPPGPAAQCRDHRLGDGRVCTPYDDLKRMAEKTCSAEGATVGDLHLADACEGGATQSWVTCCAHVAEADAGPGTPRTCTAENLGDGTTCLPYDTLKGLAQRACEDDGLVMLDLKPAGDCKDGSTSVWVQCCARDEPSYSACKTDAFGDGKTCLDFATIKQRASAACEAEKLTLSQLFTDGADACRDGASHVKYECCAASGTLGPVL